jgi:CMP/dCMP kinase
MPDIKKLIIAVDGYSSCGKSTFAKAIAQKLGYLYIDTGAMYRAVTLFSLRNHLIENEKIDRVKLISPLGRVSINFVRNQENGLDETFLNGENVESEIRGMEVSRHVSLVSAVKEVREKMVELQREMGKQKGVILDGRDIGTVVYPNADIKLFMTADPDVRAQRRYDELVAKGEKVSFAEIKENLLQRDKQDTSRAESPLRQAQDAIVLDNSHMNPKQQMEWFLKLLNTKLG